MKMVYACKRSNIGEEYVLKEYLTYKMYSILSELSLDVRLIDLTYLDIGRKNLRRTRVMPFSLRTLTNSPIEMSYIPPK